MDIKVFGYGGITALPLKHSEETEYYGYYDCWVHRPGTLGTQGALVAQGAMGRVK